METFHRVFIGDAREISQLDANTVELVVTSPPYPMIEMWDEVFTSLDPEIETALADGDGQRAFELMHEILASAWAELERVLVDGGVACINVGDATRSIDGSFRVYPNHARVTADFESLGFDPLPDILWRKPTNSAAKFMGSGMVPPNAYATLEHEYILVFRNGSERRTFEPGAERRYESAYFWEERNEWFSDLWTDVQGTFQRLPGDDLRERSAAYPLSIPYRLINMYSVHGDTVLDPFWGTGTTSLAAMTAARNSVGYEIDGAFQRVFADALENVHALSRDVIQTRLDRHEAFVAERRSAGESLNYGAAHYEFPVTTKQERQIRFRAVESVEETEDGHVASHVPIDR
jgi:DNA modification methylase